MAWTQTSNTCISLYGSLIQLKQIDENTAFDDAGPLQMQNLQYYNSAASGDINNASALALAKVMDSMLSNSFGGAYKSGFDSNKAVSTMLPVLQDGTKTVENLSDTIDTIYSFS